MKITEEEYNKIIEEMGRRVKDSVFINAERKIKKEMPKKCVEKYLDDLAQTEITYTYIILVGDLQQILGRTRRRRAE